MIAIARIADDPQAIAEYVRVSLFDRQTSLRRLTLTTLAGLGPAALTLLPDLLELIRQEDEPAVIEALMNLLTSLSRDTPTIANAVRAMLDEPPPTCDNARRVLNAISNAGER